MKSINKKFIIFCFALCFLTTQKVTALDHAFDPNNSALKRHTLALLKRLPLPTLIGSISSLTGILDIGLLDSVIPGTYTRRFVLTFLATFIVQEYANIKFSPEHFLHSIICNDQCCICKRQKTV